MLCYQRFEGWVPETKTNFDGELGLKSLSDDEIERQYQEMKDAMKAEILAELQRGSNTGII